MSRKDTDNLVRRLLDHEKVGHILAGLGVSLRDFSTGQVLPNQLWTELGHPPEVFTNDAWTKHVHVEDQERVLHALTALKEGRSDLVDAEFRLHDAAGNIHWLRHRAVVLARTDNGTPSLCVGMDTDITDLQETAQRYETRFQESETLRVAGAILAVELDPELAIERMLEQASRLIPFDSAYVWLLDGKTLQFAGGRNLRPGVPETLSANDPDYAPILASRHPVLQVLPPPEASDDGLPAPAARLAAPLLVQAKPIGCVEFFADQVGRLDQCHLWPVASYVDYVSVALRNAQSHQEAATEARLDWMTGLLNRRYFEREAIRILSSTSYEVGMSLMLVDLDHFKLINDHYGHAAGDAALRRVAEVLRLGIRASDLCCRLGGDEFAILLVGAHQRAATTIANNIRKTIERLRLADWPDLRLTTSIGICAATGNVLLSDLLHRSDKAMYQCKDHGRNQVRTSV